MAQYNKNFYSSSLYGHLKAFYGEYITDIFDAIQPFSSTINATVTADLFSTFYPSTSVEFTKVDSSKWITRGTDIVTTTANSNVEFNATGDSVEVHTRLQNTGEQTVEAKLYKEELVSGAYQWVLKQTKSINTQSLTNPNAVAKILFDSFGFGDYKVVIYATTTTAEAIIVGAKLRTSDFNLFVRSSSNKSTWSAWEEVSLTKKLSQNSTYLVTGVNTTKYTNIRYVQGKVILLSSDNKTSPIIDRLELHSADSGLYEREGLYTVQINMSQVASSLGKTFKRANEIKWLPNTQPNQTELNIRSSSSRDNIFWGPVSAPYRKNTNRVRLKRGVVNHSITLGPIDESKKFSFSKTANLLNWNTQAYLPKDTSNTDINFVFSKTQTNQKDPRNLLQSIRNPMDEKNKSIQFSPQPYFITVEMTRAATKGTPVVDFIDVLQTIQYREEVNVTNKDVSAVDNATTGVKTLQKISDYGFTFPSSNGQLTENQAYINAAVTTYQLKDQTRRPSDVMIYLKSESGKGARTDLTTSAADEIIAKAIQRKVEYGQKTGVLMNYQYGAGKVQYLRPYERELDSTFTPSLLDNKKYRYYIKNGWPNEEHTVIQGQTLNDIAEMYNTTTTAIKKVNSDIVTNENGTLLSGQFITLPNTSYNSKVSLKFKNGTLYSQKSSHNALYDQNNGETVTDFSSETISVSVPTAPPAGYVDWVSEEKIYSGVINANDTREEFIRTQYNRSSYSDFYRDYLVVTGDTWDSIADKYDIDTHDLKVANEPLVNLVVGNVIKIPPNIILPELASEAEFEKDNPYEIHIIEDSVHKKDGTKIDESFIPIDWGGKHLPMEVTFRDSSILSAEITRGSMANGMDPLPLSNVLKIVSVKHKTNSTTYHQWDNDLQTGDFKLTSNYIDWSPSKTGTLEPAKGDVYIVNYIRKEVDTVKIHLDTDFYEKMGADIVWRSPEVKVFDGVCTPTQDFRMELPLPKEFEGYSTIYKNVGYIIEDNDLWVETKLEESNGKTYLIGTMNGKDPSKNWLPTINTGYYYLKEQEFYLYSEPIKTVLSEKELPTAKNIEYTNDSTGIGVLLLPSSQNIVKDSVLQNVDWKKAKVFPA